MTVAEMLGRISGAELADWQAYEEVNGPLGPRRGDWHAALIASTVASTVPRKGKKAPRLADFLLKWKGESRGKVADPAAMEAIGRQLASRMGGTWTEGREVSAGGDD